MQNAQPSTLSRSHQSYLSAMADPSSRTRNHSEKQTSTGTHHLLAASPSANMRAAFSTGNTLSEPFGASESSWIYPFSNLGYTASSISPDRQSSDMETIFHYPIASLDPQLRQPTSPIPNHSSQYNCTTAGHSSVHSSPVSGATGQYYTTVTGAVNQSTLNFQNIQMLLNNKPRHQALPLQGQDHVSAQPAPPSVVSQKSGLSANDQTPRNKPFTRKSRSGGSYIVCPKQVYRCLFDDKCKVTKQKACDIRDHYYSHHAQFNCMQCNFCGNSYARPCTYKRHLRDDKSCPKRKTLTAEQNYQGRLRQQIMDAFGDMTAEDKVREGIRIMKKCNGRPEMRKRKRRVVCYRKQDTLVDDEDDHAEEAPMEDDRYPENDEQIVNETGSQFSSSNTELQYFTPFTFHDLMSVQNLSLLNMEPNNTPRHIAAYDYQSAAPLTGFYDSNPNPANYTM